MPRYFIGEVFFLFLMIHHSLSQIPSFQCITWLSKSNCVLFWLNLKGSNKNFKVIPHLELSAIDEFKFLDSKIEILTGDVCMALPYIKNFYAAELGLTAVEENAFKKCTKMTAVHLHKNSLESLPIRLFDSNGDLSLIYLGSNQLTEIDGNLFKNNAKNLKELVLKDNQLKEFSFSTEMSVMEKLTRIDLRSNELSDIYVEMILEKGPNLRDVLLEENKFVCSRQHNIIGALTTKNINSGLEKCVSRITPITNRKLIDAKLTTDTNSPTEVSTPETPTKIDHSLNVKQETTNLNDKHQESNWTFIILGSVLGLLTIFLGVGWIVKSFRTRRPQPDEPIKSNEPGEQLNLEVRINLNRINGSPRTEPRQPQRHIVNYPVARDDPYYEYVEGFNDDENIVGGPKITQQVRPVEGDIYGDLDEDDYDRLNFDKISN